MSDRYALSRVEAVELAELILSRREWISVRHEIISYPTESVVEREIIVDLFVPTIPLKSIRLLPIGVFAKDYTYRGFKITSPSGLPMPFLTPSQSTSVALAVLRSGIDLNSSDDSRARNFPSNLLDEIVNFNPATVPAEVGRSLEESLISYYRQLLSEGGDYGKLEGYVEIALMVLKGTLLLVECPKDVSSGERVFIRYSYNSFQDAPLGLSLRNPLIVSKVLVNWSETVIFEVRAPESLRVSSLTIWRWGLQFELNPTVSMASNNRVDESGYKIAQISVNADQYPNFNARSPEVFYAIFRLRPEYGGLPLRALLMISATGVILLLQFITNHSHVPPEHFAGVLKTSFDLHDGSIFQFFRGYVSSPNNQTSDISVATLLLGSLASILGKKPKNSVVASILSTPRSLVMYCALLLFTDALSGVVLLSSESMSSFSRWLLVGFIPVPVLYLVWAKTFLLPDLLRNWRQRRSRLPRS
jgi:hypothetical protein